MGAIHSTSQLMFKNLIIYKENFALLNILEKSYFSRVSHFKKNALTISPGTPQQRQPAGAH